MGSSPHHSAQRTGHDAPKVGPCALPDQLSTSSTSDNALGVVHPVLGRQHVFPHYRGDFEYFDGSWIDGDTSCWMCNTGPGAAAAVLASLGGGSTRFDQTVAIRTFDDAIRRYQQADGSVIDPENPLQGGEIPTIFFGVSLGEAYLVLSPQLSTGTKVLWANTLDRFANCLLDDSHVLSFYVNGNISLQATEPLYDAWRATGSLALKHAYDASWNFTLYPGSRWPGFGLIVTKVYSDADGADGSGYLAESGRGTPGFDADYTQLQLDEVTRLYVLSHDSRALLLMNLLTNQLLARTNRYSWMLNTSGGNRHPQLDRHIPFTAAAPAVLAWLTGSKALRSRVLRQLRATELLLCAGLTYSATNLYRQMGNEMSVLLLASEHAPADTPSSGLATSPMCPNLKPSFRRKLIPNPDQPRETTH